MYKRLSKPNLPQKTIKHCLIGEKYTTEIEELTALGVKCLTLKANKCLDDEINCHADILAFNFGNGKIVANIASIGEDELKKIGITAVFEDNITSPYPKDILLNSAFINNKIICNTSVTSKKIIDFAEENNIELINIKQGYSKCNICVVSDNAVITEDDGIASLLNFYQIDVLKISKGDIFLSDVHYGFLGGASGKLSKDKIYFSGDISQHRDYLQIVEFLNKHHIESVYNKSRKLRDFGGFIALTEEI